ncbi:type 4a pilus biogenesis protein PilO [Aquisphaera insulae]|uniref:type 4a pilus biogenesis protein PilO n=1 Tax=Aquisphaera insulae TaxID=2712864 RepID=UPI0013EB7979|nr:type 4a pilus biogenesis protein PilO [Aquisphaera insulae]
MTSPEKPAGSSAGRLILGQLRDPLRLRFALAAALLATWYFGFYAPTTDRMTATSGQIDGERKRAATAAQIEDLRKRLAPFDDQVPPQAGPNELIQYVMAKVRSSPVKLVDLKPLKVKELGVLQAIGLHLQVEASYEDLDAFLAWVHNDRRLLRIDALKVEPAKSSDRLAITLDLLSLADASPGKDRPGAGKPAAAGPSTVAATGSGVKS